MQTDRVVAMTGAAGGIGSALVGRFLANGDTVIAADIDADALARLARAYASSAKLTALEADTATESGCAEMAATARKQAGRVDVLVNCSGYFPARAFAEMTYAEWRHILTVNLDGVFLASRAVLPLMQGRGWGRIINIGSTSVFKGTAMQSHYVAAKAGVIGFSRSLASELGASGITVNVVTPGLTSTPVVVRTMPAEMIEDRTAQRAIRREQQADDLVGAVAFLASPDSNFMTGQTINVDGGAIYR